MKIEINKPIKIFLDVIETDQHVPSMRIQANIVVEQFLSTCSYDGTFWINCLDWDNFSQSLQTTTIESAYLRDMNGCFMIEIKKSHEISSLFLEFSKSGIWNDQKMQFIFTSTIDDDMLAKIKNEFLEFPVWW